MEKNKNLKRIIVLISFGIAFGFLEADVVVYLRYLYYPQLSGPIFPLKIVDPEIFKFEIFREISTIIILLTISYLFKRKKGEYLPSFIITFGIWDIFYYVFLYLLIGWPPSLLSFDILFLIPFPWMAPVLCPVLISLILITAGFIHLQYGPVKLSSFDIWFIILGIISVLWSFISIPIHLISGLKPEIFLSYVPEKFPFHFFISGISLLVFGLFRKVIIRKLTHK